MHINRKNLTEHSEFLKTNNYLRISNFLDNEFSEKIYACLNNNMDWDLACRIDGKSKKFKHTNDVKDLEVEISNRLNSQLNDNFQFIYNTYMMVTAYIEKRNPQLFLDRVLEWLNTTETLDYFKSLTQDNSIIKINAQATRYLPGHFLSQHNDEDSEEGRLYAYVIGLTKEWNPDWGGLLNILNSDGEIIKTIIPEYNSLSIFKVPQNHFVSYVVPFSASARLAITGWLLSK